MRKLKLFFACLLMAVLSIGQMWGTNFTLSSASQVSQDGITVSFGSGTNTSNSPTWYPAGLRLYANNTITITCNNNITGVIFNWEKQGNKAFASATASPGSYTHPSAAGDGTWEGEAKSITFTLGSSGQLQLNTFSVSVATGGTPTCAAPTFDPEDGETFEESIDVEISAEDGTTIYYTTDGNAPTTSSSVYSTALHFTSTTTVKAMAAKEGSNNSPVATATYTKIVAVHGYAINFENDLDAYVDWTFSNIGIRNSITAHGGSYYASNVNSNGNGVGSASITTNAKVATPGVLTFYVSKESGNNKTSAWTVYVSEDNSDWTEVESFTDWLSDNAGGTWHKETVDLSDYTNVYVSIDYSGSTAIRAIDDIELEMASSVAKPEISGEEDFLSKTTVTISQAAADAIYYTTNGDAPTTSSTPYSEPFDITATTTVKAIAVKDNESSAVAEQTFTKIPVLTVAEALEATPATGKYVAGIVASVTEVSTEHGNATYTLKDANANNSIIIYRGKYLENAAFTSVDQIIEGDEVTVFGEIKVYDQVNQFTSGNYIVAMYPKARLTWNGTTLGAFAADIDGENTFPTLTNTNGVDVTYSSTNGDAATINPSTGEITLVGVGSTTIAATFEGNKTYKANSVEYTLNVSSSVLKADISYECNEATTGCPTSSLTAQTNLPEEFPIPTKTGKNFGGWFMDNGFNTPAVEGAAVESADPITLYAKWEDPYNVTKALEIIGDLANGGQTTNSVYVAGIVSTAPTYISNSGQLTFYISVNGEAENELQAYNCKDLENEAFTAVDDIQVGDEVTIYGPLKKFIKNNAAIPEFNGCYLYSFNRPVPPALESIAISGTASALEYTEGDAFDPAGLTVTGTYSDASTAPITSGIEWIFDPETLSEGDESVSVTAKVGDITSEAVVVNGLSVAAADPTLQKVTFDATVDIAENNEDGVTKSGITVKTTHVDGINDQSNAIEYYQTFKNATLTITSTVGNIKKIEFTCESSNPASGFGEAYESGVWTGNAAEVVLTATVKQVRINTIVVTYKEDTREEAGMAWNPAGDVELTVGETFTAPTLTKPNDITVANLSIESDNTDLATVTEGIVSLVANATGTAEITATFTGDEKYKPATVSYTITVNAATPAPTAVYNKVTSGAYLTNGEYLIVYETGNVAFNGSLTALDAANNTVAVDVNNGQINGNETIDAATFTIDVEAGTIQSKSEYYIGHTGSSNGLKQSAESDYTNTISIDTDGNVVIKCNSRELKYNKANDQKRFRYFGSGQEDIQLYRKGAMVFATYERDVTEGRYGTICLPYAGTMTGAKLYDIDYYDGASTLYLLEVNGNAMEAGHPYIFLPEATGTLSVTYSNATYKNAAPEKGLVGSYTKEEIAIGTGDAANYILYNNAYYLVNSTAYVGANRAYIHMSDVPTEPQTQQGAPRRRVAMSVYGEQVATGMDELNTNEAPVKVMIEGQLFIIRGEKVYDVRGQLVK